jgi:hypothetical protein
LELSLNYAIEPSTIDFLPGVELDPILWQGKFDYYAAFLSCCVSQAWVNCAIQFKNRQLISGRLMLFE